jgi:hypothetical protein
VVAQPIPIVNGRSDPRGNRYSADDREKAYLTWRAHGRNLAKVVELCGISEGTAGAWKRNDGWERRAAREDDVEREANRRRVAATVAGEPGKSLAVVVAIRDDETASKRDRLDAAKFLLGVAGIAPTKPGERSILDPRPEDRPPPDLPQNLDALTPDALAALLARG